MTIEEAWRQINITDVPQGLVYLICVTGVIIIRHQKKTNINNSNYHFL
jgi:hypothetical protein